MRPALTYASRFDKYLEADFFHHNIHYIALVNSFLLVLILALLVMLVLVRPMTARLLATRIDGAIVRPSSFAWILVLVLLSCLASNWLNLSFTNRGEGFNYVLGVFDVPQVDVPQMTYRVLRNPFGTPAMQWGYGRGGGRMLMRNRAMGGIEAQALADGATALAIVTLCPPVADETLDAAYSQAQGIDPIGGYEAAVSHAVTLALGVPCAHAPVFADPLAELECHTIVNPKVAAEVVAPTYLPCVLAGLRQAPLLVAPHLADPVLALPPSRVAAWVMPCDTLASPPVLGAWARGIPVITVASNTSVLNDTAEAVLGAEQAQAYQRTGLLVPVASYLEAAGLLGLWRQGRHLPPNL
jgi:hypothetical protein